MDLVGQHVEWHYAYRGETVGRGQVIAYCDAPQVLIKTADGEHHWWRADLTRVVECDCICHREAT